MVFKFDKKNIDSKFLKLISLIKHTGLSRYKFNDILAWGEVYGKILCANKAEIYRDDDFEKLLISKYIDAFGAASDQVKLSRELHVISTPLVSGGHTRLMERIINLRKSSDVLVTRSVISLKNKLRLPKEIKIYYSEHGFDLPRLVGIMSRYETVFLHIHPDDLLSSVAVGVAKKSASIKVIFVNHADHVFSFGFFCSDVVAEISSYGFFLSKNKRYVNSSFLGIPLDFKKIQKIVINKEDKESVFFDILSAGSRLKYKPCSDLAFPLLATRILKEIPTAKITVVGPVLLADWWWWKAKLKNPIRLKILPILPYDEYTSILGSADVYLDSFPATGGTALPEIRSKGIPVSGLLTGSFGYTPFDAAKFSEVDDLLVALKDYMLSRKGDILYKNNNKDIILNAMLVHRVDKVKDRLDGMVDSGYIFEPYDRSTSFDIDFYRNKWRFDDVIRCGVSLLSIVLRNWFSGRIFGKINNIIKKIIYRKC
tara:strand:- start:1140 stop:2588 length:1449 start_codon:yes stop_codon:yes gene_type:complete